jgi:hypothetical protein
MKKIVSIFFVAALTAMVLSIYSSTVAKAAIGDVHALVTGSNGSAGGGIEYVTLPGGITNGFLQTTGSGLQITLGPVLSSTGSILTSGTLPGTSGTTPEIGQLGLSSSGTVEVFGTNSVWRNVP